MTTIHHQLLIDAPVSRVYEFIATAGNRAAALDFRQTGYDERSTFFEDNKSAWWQVLQNMKRVVEAV